MDLEELLRQPEGKRLEFKRDVSSPRPILRTLAAFANSAGGSLVVGVDDDRTVRGVPDVLEAEGRLANLIADSITPRLVPEIDIVWWRSSQLIVVTVHLSPSRPHRLNADDDVVYVRLGSSNRRADAELIAEMQRSVRSESFDESPVPAAEPDSLDLELIRTEFAGRRAMKRADLGVLGLETNYQSRTVPTVGGLILFGHDRSVFPDAVMRCARFGGTNRTHIVDSADLEGPSLPAMVRDAIAFVDRHVARSVVISGPQNEIRRALPMGAVREAIVNAAVHADYSQRGAPLRVAIFDDRLEIENPGLLPFGIAVEDLRGGVSRVRNRVIARTFKELGFIEQWGSGITRMIDETTAAGLPAPEFEEIGGRFRVTLRNAAVRGIALTPDQRVLLDVLIAVGAAGVSTSVLASEVGRSVRTVRTHMARLVELGVVYEIGSGPTDPKRRYVAVR